MRIPSGLIISTLSGSSGVKVSKIAADPSSRHFIVVTDDGRAFTFGHNAYCQLGARGVSANQPNSIRKYLTSAGAKSRMEGGGIVDAAVCSNKTVVITADGGVFVAGRDDGYNELNIVPDSQWTKGTPSSATQLKRMRGISELIAVLQKELDASKGSNDLPVLSEYDGRLRVVKVVLSSTFSAFLTNAGHVITLGDDSKGCCG